MNRSIIVNNMTGRFLFSISLTVYLTTNGVFSQACQKPGRYENNLKTSRFSESCDPKPLVYDNEGCKECMYLDSKNIKTIGVGFNLQEKSSPSVLAKVGADYKAIVNGPATAVKTPCNCSKVTCLNTEQIDQIFEISIDIAVTDAESGVTNFHSLCCDVQNSLVDMSFTLGGPTFRSFKTVIALIENQNWKAAGDDLTTTLWCVVQAPRRCQNDARAIQTGCGCMGQTKSCNSEKSACCGNDQTCCKGTMTFSNKIIKTFDEMICCANGYAECCPDNMCCATGYPVCCADKKTCCPSDYPVCCPPDYCCISGARCVSGQCSTSNGTILPRIKAHKKYDHHKYIEV